jgi:tol-pal system protein YbgF
MRTMAWWLLPALALFSCASTAPSRDEVIAHINEQSANSATSPGQASPSTSTATDLRLAELQTQMTELLERIDVLSGRIQRLENTPSEPRAVAEPAVKAEPLPPLPAPAPVAAPVPAAAPVAETAAGVPHVQAQVVMRPQDSSRAAPPASPAPNPTHTKLASAAVADVYQRAIVLYGRGRVVESRKAFQQVFDADPSGDLADNALFWLGESYYAVGDYAAAIKLYRRVTSDYADQNKAPDAMFKLGMAYEKTGDLTLAKSAFQECVKKYPYSTPASSSKAALKRIRY